MTIESSFDVIYITGTYTEPIVTAFGIINVEKQFQYPIGININNNSFIIA